MKQPATVLLIDDDAELCELLAEFLARHGFEVTSAHDGNTGLARALTETYDIVILDVMLPVLNGFEVLRQLRRRTRVPVIMLTARAEQSDRIAGLETGADDYVLKPFSTGELLARMRAVVRRIGLAQGLSDAEPELAVSPVRLNTRTGGCWCAGRPIDLTETELSILALLMREAGRTVSRDEISAILHQRQATPYERAVDVHLSHLRKKLEPEGVSCIRTSRGIGYMFVGVE